MDKLRRLLLAMPAVGLAGCATPGFNNFKKALGTSTIKGAAVPRTPIERVQADIAEGVFNHLVTNHEVRIPSLFTAASFRTAKANYQTVVAAMMKKDKLTLNDSAIVGASLAPFLRMLDHRGDGKTIKKIPASSAKAVLHNGGVTIPPGGVVNMSMQGYCMDRGLPAPITNEPLRLAPITQFISPGLVDLYRKTLTKSQTDTATRQRLQGLVWAMRDGGSYSQPVIDSMAAYFDQVEPGGGATFRTALLVDGVKDTVRSLMGMADSIAHLNLADAGAVSKEMERTRMMANNEPFPNDNSRYSMPSDQLTAWVEGASMLKPNLFIANVSDKDVTFDVTGFAAVSPRSVQRIAMPPPDSIKSKSYPMISDPNQVVSHSQYAEDLKMLLHDGLLLSPKAAGFVPGWSKKIARLLGKGLKNTAVKGLIEATPFLGNALSAYSIATGKDWLTDEPLSAADYVLNAMGTIPGAGQLERLAGAAGLPKLMKWALETSTVKNLGEVGEMTNLIADLNDYNELQLPNLIGADKLKQYIADQVQSSFEIFKRQSA